MVATNPGVVNGFVTDDAKRGAGSDADCSRSTSGRGVVASEVSASYIRNLYGWSVSLDQDFAGICIQALGC
jgi:hypothetical protein